MITVKKQFIHFLKENNFYGTFMYICEKDALLRTMSVKEYIERMNMRFPAKPFEMFSGVVLKLISCKELRNVKTIQYKWCVETQKRNKKLFIEYLKNKNVYNLFCKELFNDEGITLNKYLEGLKDFEYGFIQSAFKWASTPNDYEFWHNIDKGWHILLSKNSKANSIW